MKKLATLLFGAILAVSMSMPVFAQEASGTEGQTKEAPKVTKKHKMHKASTKVKKEKKAHKKSKKEKKSEEAPQ